MKTLESIREEIWEEMLRLEDKRKDRWADIKYQTLREVLQKLGHLDEPEVLSQEFIDEHKIRVDNWNEAVLIDDLKNLLVPKQEREQKYNVKFKVKSSFGTVGIFLYKKGDEVLAGDNFRAYYPKEDEYRLTEQEIRDFQNGDILFEHFAVKVEELEE